MEWVDQAVFTSQASAHAQGYHLAAASTDLTDDERRALARWGPSHDCVPDPLRQASIVSSFSLPSGRIAVARTFAHGAEYSRRGAIRWYTQFAVLDSTIFRRFAANPFAILTAAIASGCLNVHDTLPPVLPPIRLLGKASPVDVAAIEYAAALVGPRFVIEVVERLLTHHGPVILVGAERYQRIIAGVLNLFPVPFRARISFTTGLVPSAQRPLRIQPFYGPAIEIERLRREREATVVDFGHTATELPASVHPWTKFIAYVLNGSRWHLLKALFRRDDLPPCDTTAGLQALGRLCLEEIVSPSPKGTEGSKSLASSHAPADIGGLQAAAFLSQDTAASLAFDQAPSQPSPLPLHSNSVAGTLLESGCGESGPRRDHPVPTPGEAIDPAAIRLWTTAAEHAVLAWEEGPESFARFKPRWAAIRSRLPGDMPDVVLGATIRRFKNAIFGSTLAETNRPDRIERIRDLLSLLANL